MRTLPDWKDSPVPSDSPVGAHEADGPRARWQTWLIVGLLLAIVGLGVATEIRSTRLTRRMTDLDAYLRAAWAIRAGADPYTVTDENGWHYCYPHLLAVLLGPLADPPLGAPPITALPWSLAVAVWYAIGALAAMAAVHLFAVAIEADSPPRRFGYAWWSNRLVPFLIATPMIGRTISRGQVNTVVLALLAGWVAGIVRGRRLTAGTCLALAACIKIIPVFLFLHPLIRRDGRCLVGVALGLGLGLVVVPIAAVGPTAALAQTRTLIVTVMLPGVGTGSDTSRAKELTGATATSSQSIQTVIHNLRNPNPTDRPETLAASTRLATWSAAAFLLGAAVWIGGRRPATPRNEVTFAGALCVVMVVISPVCHLHYFVFAVPQVTALWCGPRSPGTVALLAIFTATHALSLFPIHMPGGLAMPIREFGLTTATALALATMALNRQSGSAQPRITIVTLNDLPTAA
jgi:alpha-1,2-mannosyltransferase